MIIGRFNSEFFGNIRISLVNIMDSIFSSPIDEDWSKSSVPCVCTMIMGSLIRYDTAI